MGIRRRKATADPDKARDPAAVHAAALRHLARRDFAIGELRSKLISKGYDAAVVEETLTALREEGALNDSRFAENYVAYHARRGQGPVRIGAELRALGLAAELVDAALESGPDWSALAREVRSRKFGPEVPDEWAEKGRQARFLQYRGFSSDHIRAALGAEFDPDE